MQIITFHDLTVWKKAHQFTLEIYLMTKAYPKEEIYGLTSQMRRSANSICANIAEGHKKPTKDYARYLQIAHGSLEETKYHLNLSRDLKYISIFEFEKLNDQADEIGKMIHGLRKKLI